MDPSLRSSIDEQSFDSAVQGLLEVPLDDLKMKDDEWQKFDRPCPPGNAYVYSVQRLGDIRDKAVLDFGCGNGFLSVILAKRGARVWGFDISGKSIEAANRRARANGLENRVHFEKVSSYDLPYSDEMFDFVIGLDILHHIDIEKTGLEVARVLKKGGRAVFREPFGDSPLLQGIRTIVPVKVAAHEGSQERQLSYRDADLLSAPFSGRSVREFQIVTRLERVIRNKSAKRWMNIFDEWLLKNLPFLRRYARLIVIEVIK
jgi:2-polyprenyl-3-methyl-5-hydroxy-6-metoxy-1,4-benzoquinol methylase